MSEWLRVSDLEIAIASPSFASLFQMKVGERNQKLTYIELVVVEMNATEPPTNDFSKKVEKKWTPQKSGFKNEVQ